MKIAVVGTGHVGLVTAAALATFGHEVVGTDVDEGKIALLREGRTPFFEADLDGLIAAGIRNGGLRFGSSTRDSVPGAEAVFLCVGRPPNALGDQSLVAVESAARDIARCADPAVVIVEKSTVPPGTGDRIERTVRLEAPDLDFDVVSNPEFLSEGRAVRDSLRPDRIVVGANSTRAFEVMRRVYEPLLRDGRRLIETDVRTAELSKLASNAFLALKVSYANALARLSELSGADVVGVAEIMGADPRIGSAFLGAGLGFGGYCLPKDMVTLIQVADRLGLDFALLREANRVNDEAVGAVERKIQEAVWNLEGKRVALLGLAFKPGVDDVRASPALTLARRLLVAGADIVGCDPMASSAAKEELPELEIAPDAYGAAAGAHCVVICTEWPELRELDLHRLKGVMAYPIVVDGRNFLDPLAMRAAGFTYHPTGRNAT